MTSPTPSPRHARRVLLLLAAINVLNFMDRQVIFILFEPVKRDLGLTDTALGLLGGAGFAVFFALVSVPLGRVADVWSRRRLIALGVGAWSAMTAFGLRAEFHAALPRAHGRRDRRASFGPAALALISDLFPSQRRASVMAVFASGVPIGAGLGLLIGGIVAARYGWRAAFWILGAPGLLLALLAWRLPELPRGHAEGLAADGIATNPRALGEIFLAPRRALPRARRVLHRVRDRGLRGLGAELPAAAPRLLGSQAEAFGAAPRRPTGRRSLAERSRTRWPGAPTAGCA
jgi:MFS family permease